MKNVIDFILSWRLITFVRLSHSFRKKSNRCALLKRCPIMFTIPSISSSSFYSIFSKHEIRNVKQNDDNSIGLNCFIRQTINNGKSLKMKKKMVNKKRSNDLLHIKRTRVRVREMIFTSKKLDSKKMEE